MPFRMGGSKLYIIKRKTETMFLLQTIPRFIRDTYSNMLIRPENIKMHPEQNISNKCREFSGKMNNSL